MDMIRRVLTYRNAKWGMEQVNEGKHGLERLGKQHGVMELLLELHRAQFGEPTTEADLLARLKESDEEEADGE